MVNQFLNNFNLNRKIFFDKIVIYLSILKNNKNKHIKKFINIIIILITFLALNTAVLLKYITPITNKQNVLYVTTSLDRSHLQITIT